MTRRTIAVSSNEGFNFLSCCRLNTYKKCVEYQEFISNNTIKKLWMKIAFIRTVQLE